MERVQFSQLPISEEVKRAVAELGFEEATLIQSQSIPLIMEGSDIIGHSQTGTGKTAAFAIPAIEMIDRSLKNKTQVLILCPTRELAMQACEEMRKFGKYKQGIRVVPIYGGQPIDRQIKLLRNGAEIIIGTPGRIMDHMRRRTLNLTNVSMVILDEADEMLNMGFREDIETILQDAPEKRQTILFSATMAPEIMRITKQYQKNPKLVKVPHQELTAPQIDQYSYEVPSGKKIQALALLLDYNNPSRSVVFCNTKRMVDELVSELQFKGYSADGLHGDMKQQARTTVMNSFKNGKIDVLVATDVAARGIDVDDIEAVFNFDIPQDEEYYVHRIGRTGRAGKTGSSHTLVSGRKQIYALKDIERYTKSKIELRPLPAINEVQEVRNDKLIEKISAVLKENNFKKYEIIVDKLMENDFTSVEIASAAIQIIADSSGQSNLDASELFTKTKTKTSSRENSERKTQSRRKSSRKSEPRTSKDSDSMTRLIVSVGKKDRVAANHLVGAIAGESGIPGSSIGSIDVYGSYSFVEVPNESVDTVLAAMKGCVINGRTSHTEVVKNTRRSRKKG